MPELSERHLVAISHDGITLTAKGVFHSARSNPPSERHFYESNILLLERNP